VLDSWYDIAQICLNGHTVNSMARSNVVANQKFCDTCGAATIITCQACGRSIRGYYHDFGFRLGRVEFDDYVVPSFCHTCGKSYPWIQAKLGAAQELADELDGLSQDEKDVLKKSLDDIIKDTPRTELASLRFKKLAGKASREGAEGLKNILIGVATEAAKKLIWP
jgi:hypothetical protein